MDKTFEMELERLLEAEKFRKHFDWWEMLLAFFGHDRLYGNPAFRSINGLRDADSTILRLGTIGRSVNVPVPLRPDDKNIKNFPYIYRNEVRVLFFKVETGPGPGGSLVTVKTRVLMYALPKKALQTPTLLAWNVRLLDPDGNEIKFNPSAIAQKGDWLYFIDYDTQKIYIIGANELNGLMQGEDFQLTQAPFDLGPGTPAGLPADARGEAIGADTGPDGQDYLFTLHNRPQDATQEPGYLPSVLSRLKINAETGGLAFDIKTTMGLNTQELVILPLGTGEKYIVVPGNGGMLKGGFSNGIKSDIRAVLAFAASWPNPNVGGTILLIGNAGLSGPNDLDISGLCGSLRIDNNGRIFIHAGRYSPTYNAYDYRLYEGTKALLLNAPGATLDETVELGILTVRDEGTIVTPAVGTETPYGVYCWNILYEMGELPRNDRFLYFQGSRLLITLASAYGSPEKPGNPYRFYPLGYGLDDIGAENVQYAESLAELFRQVKAGEAQKRGVKATVIPRSAASDDDGK